jgi:hypothetical protein
VTLHIRGLRQNARPIAERRERGGQRSARRTLSGKNAGAVRRASVGMAAISSASPHKTLATTRGTETALPSPGPQVSFGATRVGPLLSRLEMHLGTARFLAERRQDALWEAGCEDAALTLARLASRMTPAALDAALRSRIATGQRERVLRVALNVAAVAVGVPATFSASGDAAPSAAARCAAASTALARASLRRAARRCKRALAAPRSARTLCASLKGRP